jgi:hypothetical protein
MEHWPLFIAFWLAALNLLPVNVAIMVLLQSGYGFLRKDLKERERAM